MIIGSVGKPHGLDGTVVVHPESDNPGRFSPGNHFVTTAGRELTVLSSHRTRDIVLVSFAEIEDRTSAEALRGETLIIDAADRRSLEPGEYWRDQLVGLDVRNLAGAVFGIVEAIDDSTAQPRLLIRTSGGQVQVPFVDDLVPQVEVEAGYLVVVPIDGLFTPVDESDSESDEAPQPLLDS